MSENKQDAGRDYRETLLLPRTDFPMRAGLPRREPDILAYWDRIDLYGRLREDAKGREKYVLHDGPPYANGHLHIGHALNKILKDTVTRSMQMMGYDSDYVPGWDCHGLPIEWKIEERYRAKGRDKDAVPLNEFRRECREFAEKWIGIQRDEFKRLGVIGDWDNPYTTMAFDAEAQIARELMKFATSGQLYRGSKPVMWSVVEQTALAEAEVEYLDYTSDTVWVKFPCRMVVRDGAVTNPNDSQWNNFGKRTPVGTEMLPTYILIWTTTPWTIPGNRAISYSPRISYGHYEVLSAKNDFGPQPGEMLIVADKLAETCAEKAKISLERRSDIAPETLSVGVCEHPLAKSDPRYGFRIPLLPGDHVTDEDGTGFVHTAPGHGREDFDIWMENAARMEEMGIDTTIPFTVDADGAFTSDAPGFEGKRVITDQGKKGDANDAVIKALIDANALFACGRLTHQYPHSWRSKKPVIFRNTPQWFVAMDRDIGAKGDTLRARALKAIDETRFVPAAGQARLRSMISERPDWVLSRQRAWGVPITVFRNPATDAIIPGPGFDRSDELIARIGEAFEAEGADVWFADGAKERFLDGLVDNPQDWEQVADILDVWFDSGSTHAFVLEDEHNGGKWALKSPASLYLEGSDQHRGWFHSSLLESCGTRGRAPYEAVLTHGFTMDEQGRKMSKSLGNQTLPQEVTKQYGADILRLWVASVDYMEDQRIGPEILKTSVDSYRKLRNTMRFLLGNLHGFEEAERVAHADMPELERLILHQLGDLDGLVRKGYEDFEYRRIFSRLFNFATLDLSAFYFDIRKDALYCDPASSVVRRSCRTVLDQVFSCLTAWLAPMLSFTMEEAWQSRFGEKAGSVHQRLFPDIDAGWRDEALAQKWNKVRAVRRVVNGALEIERAEKRIGSSLEAAPRIYVSDPDILAALTGVDLAEISITSQASLIEGEGPEDAFRLEGVADIAVVPDRAEGGKCQRSWKILPEVGADAEFPDLSARDAAAVREFDRLAK